MRQKKAPPAKKIIRALVGTAEAGRRSRRATRVMFRGAWKLLAVKRDVPDDVRAGDA
jgi:hypothetical protein